MFKALLKVQWKWTRGAALLGFLIGFAIPVASIQALRLVEGQYVPGAYTVVHGMQKFGVGYAILAAGVGLAFALFAWNSDHRGRHVYALSLPLSRARYAAMRFAAGSIFLAAPAAGVLIGSVVAIAVVTLPPGLHAYPLSLTLRFFLSSFVAFAIFFAIAASSQRAAAIVLGTVATVLLTAFVLNATGVGYDVLERGAAVLFDEGGLLSVFTGRWMLIDV